MSNAEQNTAAKLAKELATARATKKRVKAARQLLERALDAIPDYLDGRNDRLCAAINKWLETPDA